MKSHMHREHAKGARIRVGSFLAPNILQPLGSDERRYLVWGMNRALRDRSRAGRCHLTIGRGIVA
jgi:hypothetical protein